MSPQQCPDHPHTLGASVNHCRECERDAAATDQAAGLAAVRAAIPRRNPTDTTTEEAK